MEKKKKVYTEEFRKQAVELAESLKNYAQAARQLGVSDASLYEWRRQMKVPSSAQALNESEQEIARLRKENAELKKVNQILKVAAAFFSQDQLK